LTKKRKIFQIFNDVNDRVFVFPKNFLYSFLKRSSPAVDTDTVWLYLR